MQLWFLRFLPIVYPLPTLPVSSQTAKTGSEIPMVARALLALVRCVENVWRQMLGPSGHPLSLVLKLSPHIGVDHWILVTQ